MTRLYIAGPTKHKNPGHTGHKHSPESIAKMRAAKLGKSIGPHSDERKAKISAANKGRVVEPTYQRTCPCGVSFIAAASNARFHSYECKRAHRGHDIRHLPVFKAFPQSCAVCASTEQLVGDHDHATGKPRGILCRNCNLAIGNMADSPARLRAAADYLENC